MKESTSWIVIATGQSFIPWNRDPVRNHLTYRHCPPSGAEVQCLELGGAVTAVLNISFTDVSYASFNIIAMFGENTQRQMVPV